MQVNNNKHRLRIDIYYLLEQPKNYSQRSTQITFNDNESIKHIYKRFMHEYKQLNNIEFIEFSMSLCNYGTNDIMLNRLVKVNKCDNVKQFHINNNYVKKYRELFNIA